MAEAYADKKVAFVGIDSNLVVILPLKSRMREHSIQFPVLKDPQNVTADAFDAVRTPEVFLLDDAHKALSRSHRRTVSSWTAEDNQLRSDLTVALDELLDGKAVTTPETEAVGCFIGRQPKPQGGNVTYWARDEGIFQNRCVECHREGEIGPFNLASYEDAIGWAKPFAKSPTVHACHPVC